MSVVRRRHLITRKGREVTGLDDEVFDQVAVEDEGLRVAGEGALLAALERNRTGRMGDIVATIQAEQDEAIRADVHGVLVVGGGPGTGKTAVALHRAAYLLYTHRRRLANQGVLLVGPSPVFLRYIEHVLPSLGEQDVQLSTISGLKPRMRVVAADPRAGRGAEGRRAHGARDPPARSPIASGRCTRDLIVLIDGLRVRLVALRHRARRSRARTAGASRTTRTARTSRAGSTTCSSRATRTRRSARTASGASTPPPSNVTSIFDRDSALDTTIAGTLARGEPTPEGWEQELRVAVPQPARGERGARTHVAGAVGRRARQRPLRVPRAGALRVEVGAQRRRAGAAAPPARSRRRHGAVDRRPTSRWSTKPTRCSARSKRPGPRPGAATAAATPTTPPSASSTTSGLRGYADAATLASRFGEPATATATVTKRRSSPARSGTCSSTRPRTSPRCSGGCSPAAARRVR